MLHLKIVKMLVFIKIISEMECKNFLLFYKKTKIDCKSDILIGLAK